MQMHIETILLLKLNATFLLHDNFGVEPLIQTSTLFF